MYSSLRTLFVFGIFTLLLFIYATNAGSILSAVARETMDQEKCRPAGAECGQDPPCCNPKCRVNWGGAWCT